MLGMKALGRKMFGSSNDRLVKAHMKTVAAINALEPDYEKLADDELREKTDEFAERLEAGEKLDDLIPEALEHGSRTLVAWGVMVGLTGMLALATLLPAL